MRSDLSLRERCTSLADAHERYSIAVWIQLETALAAMLTISATSAVL
jgi:hypothetical protein